MLSAACQSGPVIRILTALLTGAGLGALPAAFYAGLVGGVHLAVYGRWDRVPNFALGCVLGGTLLGLVVSVARLLLRWGRPALPGDTFAPPAARLPRREAGSRITLPVNRVFSNGVAHS